MIQVFSKVLYRIICRTRHDGARRSKHCIRGRLCRKQAHRNPYPQTKACDGDAHSNRRDRLRLGEFAPRTSRFGVQIAQKPQIPAKDFLNAPGPIQIHPCKRGPKGKCPGLNMCSVARVVPLKNAERRDSIDRAETMADFSSNAACASLSMALM